MKRYRLAVTGVVATALLVTLAACGPSEDSGDDGPVTISFMHRWPEPGRSEYFEGIVDRFNESQDKIHVVSSSAASEPYKQEIQVLASQDKLPDIYYSLPGEFAERFVRGGMAADLSEYFEQDSWGESFIPATLEAYRFDESYYGVPVTLNLAGIVYNTKMFSDLGISAPSSIEDLLNVCDALNDEGILPVAFGNKDIWPGGHIPTVLNAGYVDPETRSEDYSEPEEGSFTDPGYLKSLETTLEIKQRCMAENVNGQTLDPVWAEWGAGDAAMAFMTMGNYFNIRDAAETGAVGEDWTTIPWPKVEDGVEDQNSMMGAPDGFLVSEASEHKEEAIEFLRYLTDMSNAERMSEDSGLISTVEGASENLAPQQRILLEAAGEADALNVWLDTVLPSDLGDIYTKGVQSLFGGESTPEDLFSQLQEAAGSWQQ